MGAPAGALLIYDGGCRFCRGAVEVLMGPLAPGTASARAWQDLGDEGLEALQLSTQDVEDAAWWVDAGGRRWRGHEAVAQALVAAGGWRGVLGAIGLSAPFRPFGRVAYRLVARYRRHLPVPTRRRPG